MDKFQKSTQEVADKVADYLGFKIPRVMDYDFQADYGRRSFMIQVSPHGPDEQSREVRVYRGGYDSDEDLHDILTSEPLIRVFGHDEEGLGGAVVGFIISL